MAETGVAFRRNIKDLGIGFQSAQMKGVEGREVGGEKHLR
jgi:hypothetical protein